MTRYGLLGWIIICVASLALAQTGLPSTTLPLTNSPSTTVAQTDSLSTMNVQDRRPRLEFEPRLSLNGAGFQLVSGSMTAGAGMEDKHFAWHVYGTYDAATKATYETGNSPSTYAVVTNPHGDIRSVGGSAWGRTSGGWLFGASSSYASLRTTDYDKISWGAEVGAGHDWMHATCPNCSGPPTSLRLTVQYGLPLDGWNKKDTENGFTADFYVPSPIETNRHIFFHATAFAGWVCDPKCGHDGSASDGVLFRF